MEAHEALEHALSRWQGCGYPEVVACSSGTAALHLALEAIPLPPGSKVVIPDYTMVACARAVVLAGLTPVFVDCTTRLLLNLDLVDEACAADPHIRAVMPVHVYGRRVPMDELAALAAKYDLRVIEDLAEAHGVPPHQATDAACWSFYRNKIVHGEEGGAVAFREAVSAARARSLRCLGFTADHDYRHTPRGMNYRLAPSLARLILTDLPWAGLHTEERRRLEGAYEAACPADWRQPPRQAPWVYDLRIPGLGDDARREIVTALVERGVAARHGFQPMHLQPEFRHCRRWGGEGAARASREVLYLPLDPVGVRMEDCGRVFGEIVEMLVGSARMKC